MNSSSSSISWRTIALSAAAALVCGFAGAAAWSESGLGDDRVRAYLLDNPEVLPLMAEELQARDQAERLAEAGTEVYEPFPGAVLGNPQGSKTLVEFSDYNCGYCRASQQDVRALIAGDPGLRVVLREWPIMSQGSEIAARMALAAAMQGKYAEFHDAMFERAPADAKSVDAAARAAGLDMDRAAQDVMSDPVTEELARNQAIANMIGFSGTPGWIVGDRVIAGAVGEEELEKALTEAGPPVGAAEGRGGQG